MTVISNMALDKSNFVNVGLHGTFRATGQVQSTSSDIDALVEKLKANPQPVLLHFHGGLVSEQQGMDTAAALTPVYEAAGCHSVTVVWETGFLETVSRNLGSIYRTELFRELLEIVLKHAAKRLGLEAGGRGGGVELSDAEIENELDKPAPFEEHRVETVAQARGGAMPGELTEDEIEVELELELAANDRIGELLEQPHETEPLEAKYRASIEQPAPGARGIPLALLKPLAKITYRVTRRYWNGRQHGFYPTVIEELLRELYLASAGHWIWGSMKKAAADMFRSNAGLSGDHLHAGLYLIAKLASAGLTVNLAGHSAGSIAICELLAAAEREKLDLKVRNLLLMAPACTSELFWSEIGLRPHRYERFRMFTMHDDWESRDMLVPYVYPRSLLYLVSGIMEDAPDAPIAGMQRFLSGRAPFDTSDLVGARDFFSQSDRLVLAKTAASAAEGLRCGALKHGAFNEDALTRKSLQFALSL